MKIMADTRSYPLSTASWVRSAASLIRVKNWSAIQSRSKIPWVSATRLWRTTAIDADMRIILQLFKPIFTNIRGPSRTEYAHPAVPVDRQGRTAFGRCQKHGIF
jgi:hypothetical protein